MSIVIDLQDFRIKRERDYGIYGVSIGRCAHKNTTFDEAGDVFSCDDCKMQLSAVWMFWRFVKIYEQRMAAIKREREELSAIREKEISLISAKQVEAAWRKKRMLPACPHCHKGIGPNDGFGKTMVGKPELVKP